MLQNKLVLASLCKQYPKPLILEYCALLLMLIIAVAMYYSEPDDNNQCM